MRESTPNQRAERQLRAAYRLILTWPIKHQQTPDAGNLGGATATGAGSITTTPQCGGDTDQECSRNDSKAQPPDRGQRSDGSGQCSDV